MKLDGRIKIIFTLLISTLAIGISNGQDYSQYFLNRSIADSLIRIAKFKDCIPYYRRGIQESEMMMVSDEFYLGYCYFKVNHIDSAKYFLTKAVNQGFYFPSKEHIDAWQSKDVFRGLKMSHIEIEDKLTRNTYDHAQRNLLDSTLSTDLIAVRKLDQKYRATRGTQEQWAEQLELDRKNQQFLNKILDKYGWPGEALVGYDGANAAFLIAQHSDLDTAFQKKCLSFIQQAYYKQDINLPDYAYLIDRVRINSNRPQLFGTQFYSAVDNGKSVLKLKPVEKPEYLNLRRKHFGLPPVEEYLQSSQLRIENKK